MRRGDLRRRRLVAALLVVVALGILSSPLGAGEKKKRPKEWDERVQPFVDFVEETRELEFDHPVTVRFLSDKKFEAELRADYDELTDEDKALDQQLAGELVALGLAAQVVDLSQASEDLDAEGTVGFYDPEVEELVVRGTDAGLGRGPSHDRPRAHPRAPGPALRFRRARQEGLGGQPGARARLPCRR